MLKYFSGSFWFAGCSLAFVATLAYFTGGAHMVMPFLVSAVVLAALEVSVSLDNAVVNAKYLEKMNQKSIDWFMTWGVAIAVFGMRMVFPILIVCIAAWVNPWAALKMALFHPEQYEVAIHSVHIEIMGFGAAFLLMVALEFFMNAEKESHWIPGLERLFAFLGKFPSIQILIGVPVVVGAGLFAPHEGTALMLSGLGGLLTFYFVHGLKELLEAYEEESAATMVAQTTKLMIGSLIFLEVLDASFSFDGVIAAFAITNNFLVIAASLGIGAMFVRSFTVYLVEKKTMSQLKYLENAAFAGIAWLVAAMYMSAYGIEVGEAVVAGGAAGLIVLGLFHSLLIREPATV